MLFVFFGARLDAVHFEICRRFRPYAAENRATLYCKIQGLRFGDAVIYNIEVMFFACRLHESDIYFTESRRERHFYKVRVVKHTMLFVRVL